MRYGASVSTTKSSNRIDFTTSVEAQKNPDQYRNLIVRVGGYSDYFVNLEKGLQDNVIARTFAELG